MAPLPCAGPCGPQGIPEDTRSVTEEEGCSGPPFSPGVAALPWKRMSPGTYERRTRGPGFKACEDAKDGL